VPSGAFGCCVGALSRVAGSANGLRSARLRRVCACEQLHGAPLFGDDGVLDLSRRRRVVEVCLLLVE
jgi:hypothetical protein